MDHTSKGCFLQEITTVAGKDRIINLCLYSFSFNPILWFGFFSHLLQDGFIINQY